MQCACAGSYQLAAEETDFMVTEENNVVWNIFVNSMLVCSLFKKDDVHVSKQWDILLT